MEFWRLWSMFISLTKATFLQRFENIDRWWISFPDTSVIIHLILFISRLRYNDTRGRDILFQCFLQIMVEQLSSSVLLDDGVFHLMLLSAASLRSGLDSLQTRSPKIGHNDAQLQWSLNLRLLTVCWFLFSTKAVPVPVQPVQSLRTSLRSVMFHKHVETTVADDAFVLVHH